MQVEVDRQLLLAEVLLLQLRLGGDARLELLDLRLRVEEIAGDRHGDEDREQHEELRRHVPGAGIVPVGALELVDERVEVEGHGI